MPRKAKTTIERLAELELLSRDMSMPEEIRAQAAKEYIRLTLTLKGKPAPAPVPVVYSEEDMAKGFAALAAEAERLTPKPTEVPVEEIRPPEPVESEPIEAREPEPVERQRDSIWRIVGVDYIYLGMDDGLHMLTETRSTGYGPPEVIRVSEAKLTGQRPRSRPTGRCETPEQVMARRRLEQAREYEASGWVRNYSLDPPGC